MSVLQHGFDLQHGQQCRSPSMSSVSRFLCLKKGALWQARPFLFVILTHVESRDVGGLEWTCLEGFHLLVPAPKRRVGGPDLASH